MNPPRRASNTTIREFREQLHLAGLKPNLSERGPASGLWRSTAERPCPPILDCLLRNRGEMFDARLARKRQIKLSRKGS